MTVDEIRENAKPKHECECERLKKQIAELEEKLECETERANIWEQSFKSAGEIQSSMTDEWTELYKENLGLHGQITALKFAIKQLAKR